MTKTLLSAALIAGLGIAAFAPQAASASDGTITFTGAVSAATCSIKVNGGSASATVTLPTVQTSDLAVFGTATGYTAVSIALSNCNANSGTSTTVVPYFEQGPTTDMATGYLQNSSSGTAKGVEVMLSTSNTVGSALKLQNDKLTQGGPAAAGFTPDPTFTYYASYVSNWKAPATGVTAGSVSTTVQYDLSYN